MQISAARTQAYLGFFLPTLLAVCGAILMFHTLALGPGTSPDSAHYVAAARSLLAGNGLYIYDKPLTHFPPGYPILLGLAGWFTHGDVLLAARWVAAIFYGLNLMLFVLAIRMGTNASPAATGMALLLFVFVVRILDVHAMAWSEAPYIFFSSSGLMLLALHIKRPVYTTLVACSIMLAMAICTRYIGVVLIPVGIIALLISSSRKKHRNIVEALVLMLVAAAPLTGWMLRNSLVSDSSTNRELVYHPIDRDHLTELLTGLSDFMLPVTDINWVRELHVLGIAMLFIYACVYLYKSGRERASLLVRQYPVPIVFLLYALLYTGFLLLSISFFDAATPLDKRILLPIFLASTIAIASTLYALSKVSKRRTIWSIYFLLALMGIGMNAGRSVSRATSIREQGMGMSKLEWQNSLLLSDLRKTSSSVLIYSNEPERVMLHANRRAETLPRKVFPTTLLGNPLFSEELDRVVDECRSGQVQIIYFGKEITRTGMPSRAEIDSAFAEFGRRTYPEGILYAVQD